MKKNLFIFFTGLSMFVAAQNSYYVSEYAGNGAEENHSIINLGNNLYTAGFTSTFGNGQSDGLLNKYALGGTLLWSKAYGGSGNEEFRKIKQLQDGNLLIVGLTSSYSNFTNNDSNIFVVKTDTAGAIIWSRTFGGPAMEKAIDFTENADSSLLILGSTTSIGAGEADIMLLKLDKAGNYLWSKSQGDVKSEIPTSILSINNGYLICGSTNSFGLPGYFPFILRVNSIGDYLWAKTYESMPPGLPKTTAYKIINGYFSDYLVVGRYGMGSINDAQPFALDVDTSGTYVWGHTYLFNSGDCAYFSVMKTNDNNFLMSGNLGNYYPMGIKMNPLGQLIFNNVYGYGTGNFGLGGYVEQACEVGGAYVHAGYSLASGDTKSLLISSDVSGNTGNCDYLPTAANVYNYQPTVNARTFSKTTTNYSLLNTCGIISGALTASAYCFTMGIEKHGDEIFHLYPNPGSDHFTITSDIELETVTVFDALGKNVKQIKCGAGLTSLELSLNDIQPGLYFITVSAQQQSATQKLILQH